MSDRPRVLTLHTNLLINDLNLGVDGGSGASVSHLKEVIGRVKSWRCSCVDRKRGFVVDLSLRIDPSYTFREDPCSK